MGGNPTVIFMEPRKVIIEERPIPKPGKGEMLVKTSRTLVSTGTELTILSGEFPPHSRWAQYGRFPFVPGYDNIGTVIEVGEGVEEGWIGKKVASYASHASYVRLKPENVRIVPDGVPDEEASFFTIAEIVMNGVRRGGVQWGEAVAVYGLGLLGQLTVRFCHLAGAKPVIGIDLAESRLKLLPQKPRIRGINPERENPVEVADEITRGRMVDVVFEVTGNPEVIPREFDLLKRQGRLVILSSPRGTTREFDFHDLCNAPSYTIIGAHNSSHPRYETPYNQWTQKRHAELFFDLILDGELDMRPLISHTVPYSQAPEIYAMLLEDRSRAMGVVFEW
jgi:2-desacetyl-2-hydroxyethyl bacteriochlorophyllide A dehydrogenase